MPKHPSELILIVLALLQNIETIEYFDKLIQAADDHISHLMAQTDSPIISVTGFGQQLGAVILAEIRNINNFDSPSQLQSFAGLEPSGNQSGESDKTGKVVKRGTPHLRWAIIQAAKLAANYRQSLMKTYRRSSLKANTTILPSVMSPRNSFVSYSTYSKIINILTRI